MSMSGPAAVIVLAAGEGTRMKSSTPKVLNQVCGRAMLGHAVAVARELDPVQLIAVISDGSGPVARYLGEYAPDVLPVVQARRGGTGHAVRTVLDTVGVIGGTVVVTYGDTPLLRGRTLAGMVAAHEAAGAAVTALVARAEDPTGYGRIVRGPDGVFAAVVEHADATDELGPSRRSTPACTPLTAACWPTPSSGCPRTTPRARSTSPTCWPS